jgi:SAM-dependent methyltransferase
MRSGDPISYVQPMNYKVAYAIGFHPWEDAESCPAFAGRLLELIGETETQGATTHGRALDIGTGSGIWGIAMAKRGWQVTGVDNVARVLQRAEQRVAEAGVDMDLVEADVTAMAPAQVGGGYRLVVDTGTFHDFDPAQRAGMGRSIDAVAAPDATVILTVWPHRRRPLIRGVDQAGIEAAFPGWQVEDVGPSGYRPPKLLDALLRPEERFYLLRRDA